MHVNMYNPDHHHLIGPRISFSNDFVVEPPPPSSARNHGPPPDPNFEFSVGSRPLIMAADQLFSKGRLLPLKESTSYSCYSSAGSHGSRITTLRDELRANDDGSATIVDSQRPPKGSSKWKGFLGLKKSHCSSKKVVNNADKNASGFEATEEQ